ncbi:hypothetical protein B0J11DRAFT_469689 [Dendryphion nanum]|uniref:Tetratricopeptide repeat protein 1 n=1 Tax=Dendryphion nanum TaxID=256645 RepID=A0A9P9DDS4_9PLEO|nr:hypothetical protein B0J11DRAFT_469689 [Dendryphion nanum]
MATAIAIHDYANGTNGVNGADSFPPPRYSKVPPTITITVAEQEEGPIDIEISLDEDIQEDPDELCTLLENEQGAKGTWLTVAIAYAKHKKADVAIEVLQRAIATFTSAQERLSILGCLCWLYLFKCRQAPRLNQGNDPDVVTKEDYIQKATQQLNEASRISPSYPPLFLARGVLYLLRASLQAPAQSAGLNQISSERLETLKQAGKCFEDALRASHGKSLLAKLGKARVNYSLGKYTEALKIYQSVLESSPGLIDPDPRIGIGCCFWNLGYKDDAAQAWQRSLELNPSSKGALILLGIYNLHLTAQLPVSDPNFLNLTKKAMSKFILPAFQADNKYPLTCATLASFYTARKDWDKVHALSKRAIDLTDVNDIASDGWYYLARKAHQEGDIEGAATCYKKANAARGGEERGYIPAKFGVAQTQILKGEYDNAKFQLEKILQQQPTLEAQIVLGTLYAEDVFNAQASNSKDDKSNELKKALKYLEDVVKTCKDPKKRLQTDQAVLLNLARLYESAHPDKSLKCLEEVEQMELDAVPEEDYPENIEDDTLIKPALRQLLPPQLLNNMGCFQYQNERFAQARDLFTVALKACVTAEDRDNTIDADALVTTISYNLGRTYEAETMFQEAKDTYESLLKRHPDYIDARIRHTYITLRQKPTDEGPKAVAKLYEEHKDNLQVRALYGWYVSKSKKKSHTLAEDQEQRHYKHTLQGSDKHDRYSLTGMGNVHLAIAREMPRSTEQDKEKRRKTYEKAVEFFDKVLSLDPKNAYAAQGIAIALIEDKKDYSTALQIMTKIKETLKDYTVYVNLGHTYCDIKQYSRAIENYEAALAKDRQRDPSILSCLGRVWLLRGKHEKSLMAMKQALEYSRRALDISPENSHFKFNVAFVQFQIAQFVHSVPEAQRTLTEVEAAAAGLDEAIDSFNAIANLDNPPYPKNDIEQRARMGQNTMRNQLDRAAQSQRKYEEANASKLQQAREAREAEQRKREEEKRAAEAKIAEQKRKAQEERQKQVERDREIMEKRSLEDRRRQELIDDSEMRRAERSTKRKGGKRKKKTDLEESDESDGNVDSDTVDRPRRRRTSASGTEGLSEEERPKQKKRKLERRKKEPVGKYKSAEFVASDDDSEPDVAADTDGPVHTADASDSAEEGVAAPRSRKRIIDEDEEDDPGSLRSGGNGDMAMDEDEDEDEDE